MSAVTASQYRTNVLFRLLAFLDDTGTQPFVLSKELDADGRFLHPDKVFGEGTAIAAILAASLRALRSNIRCFFKSGDEEHALLSVIGTGAVEPKARASDSTTRAASDSAKPTVEMAPQDGAVVDADDAEGLERPSANMSASLPIETTWSFMLSHPVSLAHYAEQVENELPIHLLVRLREVLGIAATAVVAPSSQEMDAETRTAASAFSSTPFVEQLLIDGLDEWMRTCPVEEVRRMILACGVQPVVLESAFEQQPTQRGPGERGTADREPSALPDALVDFVVDVIFPVSPAAASASPSATATQSTVSTSGDSLQDWLLLSYEKNREVIEVGEDEEEEESMVDDGGSDGESTDASGSSPRKLPRAERGPHLSQRNGVEDELDSLGAWQPAEGEEVLTADNIDRYLKECPQRIPKEILREKRKPITDAAITAFELENHYTAAELRKLVKDEVGCMTATEASTFMRCGI